MSGPTLDVRIREFIEMHDSCNQPVPDIYLNEEELVDLFSNPAFRVADVFVAPRPGVLVGEVYGVRIFRDYDPPFVLYR